MKTLPASPDISHLKKQSKQLLKAARAENPEAIARFVEALPSLRDGVAPTANVLRLHNAQSVIAREYGFPSWPQLKRYVEWKRGDRAERLASWLRLVLEGNAARRRLAMRMMDEEPDLFAGDPWVACVLGDLSALRGVRNFQMMIDRCLHQHLLREGFVRRLLDLQSPCFLSCRPPL